ncbi:hypothetical protein GGR26_002175 [Lewinella marina]|uniref:Uncharacterized protein n=1 Tax=Neolewinella marina TaxID=438751 RepID=A0A2G0CGT3_9BACT|nr:hypothetical protein [Neolewinella marina]NJB86407.1 hypothetical protein [Neolewinella marina]PHK99127.1 hypothetical protein CGL56_06610 [Neolewinella marina]
MPYSEQQIRGLAINFLRFHYKLRPRYGGSGTRIVDKPHYYQGVLIDARLAYQRPDRTYFIATVEATSLDRRDEILYRVNYWRIGIHALVLSCALAAAFVWWGGGARVPEWNLYAVFGSPRVYGVLLLSFAALFVTVAGLLSRLRGYRYIYAVDQFKHFYADAQWVAYDAEIFAPDTWRTRRQYRELERQCVKYGFGILAVEADKVVRNVMSPSRIDQFSGHRSLLPRWLARAESVAPPQPALPPPELEETDPLALPPPPPALLPARPGRPSVYRHPRRAQLLLRARLRRWYRSLFPDELRRRPGYYKLGWWVFLLGVPAVVMFGWGLYRQSTYSPLAVAGGRYAEPDLDMLESTRDPAPALDPESGEFQRSNDSLTAEGEEPAATRPGVALVATDRIEDLELLRRYQIDERGGAMVDYDCVPLYQQEAPVFILLFGRYQSFETARAWALELNRLYGSVVTVAATDCVLPEGTGYLLYLDQPTTDEGTANYIARSFAREFGLGVEIIEIE